MSYGFGYLNDLCERAYKTSEEHGFWELYRRTVEDANEYIAYIESLGGDKEAVAKVETMRDEVQAAIIAQKLALIDSEVAEALEEHRAHGFEASVREDGKPEGWGSELADIFIRLGDLAVATGVNLEQEIVNKMAFNNTRPIKHGKRY